MPVRKLYAHELDNQAHIDLVSLLLNLKGMAVLSGYAHPIYEPLETVGKQLNFLEVG